MSWPDDPDPTIMGVNRTLFLVLYGMSVFTASALTIMGSAGPPGQPQGVPWVPRFFYTDGVLVWFVPLAVVLPILLWPLSLVVWGASVAYVKGLEADAFCGISRGTLRRRYRALRRRLRGGNGYEEVDLEDPVVDGTSPAEPMLAASWDADGDEDAERHVEQESEISAGSKSMQDEPLSTTERGEDVGVVDLRPPEYQP